MTRDRITPSIDRRVGYFVDAHRTNGTEFSIDGDKLRLCLGTDNPARRLPGWIRRPVANAAAEHGITERSIIAQLEQFAAAQLPECSFAPALDGIEKNAVCNIVAIILLSSVSDAAKVSILQQFVGGYIVKAGCK